MHYRYVCASIVAVKFVAAALLQSEVNAEKETKENMMPFRRCIREA